MSNKIDKLQELIKMVNESLTREEFVANFSTVIEAIKVAKKELAKLVDAKTDKAVTELEDFLSEAKKTLAKIENDNQAGLSTIKKWALEKVSTLYANSNIEKLVYDKLSEVDAKMIEMKVPDTATIALEASKLALNEVLPKIPDNINLEQELPKYGQNIVDSINLLSTEDDQDKIDIEHIKGLRDELDRIIRMSENRVVVGGGSRQSIYYYDLTDSLDGVTTTFNVPAFTRILKVETFSAAVLRPNTDWSYDASAHTVTFNIDPATYLAVGQTVIIYYAI